MIKWEYKQYQDHTVSCNRNELTSELNKLGAARWEVCGVIPQREGLFTVLLKRSIKMCDEIKDEIEEGQKLATAMAEHLERMNAAAVEIPVILNGVEYVVIVRLK